MQHRTLDGHCVIHWLLENRNSERILRDERTTQTRRLTAVHATGDQPCDVPALEASVNVNGHHVGRTASDH